LQSKRKIYQMEHKAIYPGSFDPITNGHLDIIKRCLDIFDKILVAVLENPKKRPLFSTEERVNMIKEIFKGRKNIEVKSFDGLLVDFAEKNNIKVVIRGLRAISDFEYEFQMAQMNQKLKPDIETFFMVPNVKYTYLSSKLVKEIFMLGGSIQGFVPKLVESQLQEKFKKNLKNYDI